MIDLETLATTADAVIMSIGAVRFDMDGTVYPATFYASVSVDSNLERGRKISESTLIWWMGQSPEAQRVFNEPKTPLASALQELAEWVERGGTPVEIWSNGASFDIPMLEHAYTQHDLAVPWPHWASRCVRTYKNLPGANDIVAGIKIVGTAHNALDDAIHQARQVIAIHKALFGAEVAA